MTIKTLGWKMNCPKCSSDRVEKSSKTWVCYSCMHIWMDKPASKQMIGPQCDCGKGAVYMTLVNGDWHNMCKGCLLILADHLTLEDKKRTVFKLTPNTFDYFYKELLTEQE